MYSIYADDICIYNDVSPDEKLKIISPKLVLEDSAAGSLEITLPPINPGYDYIIRLDTDITVKKNGEIIWMGRVLTENQDFWKNRILYCEGELSFLNDTTQPPAEYHNQTVRGFLTTLINIHNSKAPGNRQFLVGAVTVTDNNDSLYRYTNYEKTIECINKKLIERLGGHLRIRHINGVRYIDYLADCPNTNSQTIEFGKNLLDFTRKWDSSEFATVIVPLGARLEESPIAALEAYLTVESVNNGSIYVQSEEAVAEHGWIEKVVNWDDVSVPANLLSKARAYLTDLQFDNMNIELSALDMHYLNVNYEAVKLLDNIRVISRPHGMDRYFPVTKLEIPLDTPESTQFTLGDSVSLSLTRVNNQISSKILQEIDNIPKAHQILDEAKDNATAIMRMATNGHITITQDENGSNALYLTNTRNYEDATKMWLLNMNGFGYSNDGGETFGLAITMDGAIVADYITAGTLRGELLRAGSVSTEALSLEYRNSVSDAILQTKTTLEQNYIAADGVLSSTITQNYTNAISQSESRNRTLINQTKNEIEVRAEVTYSTKEEVQALESLFLSYVEFEDSNGEAILDNNGEVIKARTTVDGITAVEVYSAIDISAQNIKSEVASIYATQNAVKQSVQTLRSEISASATDILITVSETYAEKTELEETERSLSSSISMTTQSIMTQVSNNYATKSALNATESNLRTTISQTASSITTEVNKKVNGTDFGTYMQQNYNSFIIGFNNASRTLQLTASGLSVYDGTISTNNKLITFSDDGMRFYEKGHSVGKIGTNHWLDYESYRGLVFDLEYTGKFMAWAREKTSTATSYTTVLTYARSGAVFNEEGLYVSTTMFLNGNKIKAANLTDVRSNGYSTYTGSRKFIKEFSSTSTSITYISNITAKSGGGISWTTSTRNFITGTSCTWGTYSIQNGMFIN